MVAYTQNVRQGITSRNHNVTRILVISTGMSFMLLGLISYFN